MENGVINLCSSLPKDRYATSICTLIPDGKLEARARSRGIPVLNVQRRFGNDPGVPFQLARILRRERVDVLHSHNWGTLLEAYAAGLLNRRTRIVHGEHGRLMTESRRVVAQRFIWPRCQRMLSVSNDLANRMNSDIGYPRDPITVIPNGVDITKFKPLPNQKERISKELGLPVDRFTVGMVARFVEFKDHAGAINALASLVEQGLELQLALIGSGGLEPQLRSQVKELSLVNRVFFLGHREDVSKCLPAFDAIVSNSSHCEGMSNAVLESMACGVPVIGTTTAANPELLDGGQAGRLVSPKDQSALCSAITELYENPSITADLSSISRNRVVNHYPLHKMMNSYGDLYAEVCGSQEPKAKSR